MAIFEWRRQRRRPLDGGGTRRRLHLFRPLYSRKLKRMILFAVVFLAIVPPLFFHFKLRRIRQNVAKKCDWLQHPPRVCAHGGDSTLAFPNTVCIYTFLESRSLLPPLHTLIVNLTLSIVRWMLTVTRLVLVSIALRLMFLVPPMVFYSLSTTGYRARLLSLRFVSFCIWILIIGDVLRLMIIICTVRDLQRIARNSSVQVGDLSMKQVSHHHHHLHSIPPIICWDLDLKCVIFLADQGT